LRADGKAPDVADADGDRQPEQLADAGNRDEQADARVGPSRRRQLALQRRQPRVKVLDDGDRFGDRAPPHVRHATALEQLERVGSAQPIER
jgi:hypothetical protein